MANFGSLSIGISGLYANRAGLQTVSHNIANADNTEYTRQRVNFQDSRYASYGSFKVGTGIDIQSVNQIRDEFLDIKLRDQVSQYGYWGQRYNIFAEMSNIIGETGQISPDADGGLAKVMDDFWKSMDEIAKDPTNLTVRGVFKERAESFVTVVRHTYDQLDTLQKSLNTRVINIVDETNKISKQIADLNKEIVSREASGVSANDYKDKRNGLIDKLSQIANISVSEDSKGYVNIAIAGTHIVLGGSNKELEYRNPAGSQLAEVYWKGEENPLVLDKDLKSGELKAILEARGSGDGNKSNDKGFQNGIPAMKEKLNTLVSNLVDRLNEVQMGGAPLDWKIGNDVPPMFVNDEGKFVKGSIDASNIKLNIKSLNDIAASTKDDFSVGNGKNAEALLAIRKEVLDGYGKMNIDDYYRDVVSAFGIAGNESYNMMEASGRIIIELDNRKQSISSVSLDEEMSEMLKFQHAYSANTRFINAIDEMIDNIVNRMAV